MEERTDIFARKFLLAFGVILVVFGGVILIYLGYLVLQVINDPENLRIGQYILEQFKAGDLAFYGNLEEKRFTVHLSDSMQTAVFLFVGVLVLWVLARIVQSLISGGIKMISASMGRYKYKSSGETPRSYDLSELEG